MGAIVQEPTPAGRGSAVLQTPRPSVHKPEPPSPAYSSISTNAGASPLPGLVRNSRRISEIQSFRISEISTEGISLEDYVNEPPVHRPKLKGEHQPLVEPKHKKPICEKTQKLLDEAHNFGLCEHYSKLLHTAKEIGFKNVKWPTNFTLFHLAAKKNNKDFLEFLLKNDFDDLHTIDDFGKKPIDYACPHKRDSVFGYLQTMMSIMKAKPTEMEKKYQAIKAGTWVDPEKQKKKEVSRHVNCMAEILERDDIAVGDMPGANKNQDLMSAYEAELLVPAEFKKCFKTLANGNWAAMEGKWPKGGETVLHWGARHGKDELCKFLVLEYGADPKEEDGNGHDSIYYAKLKRHRKLAKALLLKFKEPKLLKKKK